MSNELQYPHIQIRKQHTSKEVKYRIHFNELAYRDVDTEDASTIYDQLKEIFEENKQCLI